jgi:hypothetical protein
MELPDEITDRITSLSVTNKNILEIYSHFPGTVVPNQINWELLSRFQKLSEEFISRFSDSIDWFWVSISQKLSEDLI